MSLRMYPTKIVSWLGAIVLISSTMLIITPSVASAATISQIPPTGQTGTTNVDNSASFSDVLNTSGSSGTETYLATGGTGESSFNVNNATGAITTTGQLAVGSYNVTGSDADSSSDAGTWSYTLTVTPSTINQTPQTGTTNVAGSAGFNGQLVTTGSNGTESFAATGGAGESSFNVSATGAITTTGQQAVGSYNVTGSDTDTSGDTGNWSFTLTVTSSAISQNPQTGTTNVDSSAGFNGQLVTTGSNGTESFAATGGAGESSFNVSATGAITTTGQQAVGSYLVTGTDTDTLGDTGNWSFTLTVTHSTISQTPQTGTTTVAVSASFLGQLVTTGSNGTESFAATGGTGESSFNVSATGAITTTGQLIGGVYTVTGTDTDTLGDTGTWSYTLTVTGGGGGGGGGAPLPTGALVQTSPTTGTISTDNSSSYTGSLTVSHATGAVTYLIVTASPALSVSAQGNIATTGPLATGVYTVSGTDSDPQADTGTWVFSLTVNASITVAFDANGGTGTMKSETKVSPTALTPNEFTWSKHVFGRWNTAADGSGTSLANGAVYPFTTSTTLYAQWTATTHVAPKRTVTFDANGGSGFMSPETKNALASLTPNSFNRKGFHFVNWNTAANGFGTSYDDTSAYTFNRSTTLYAQWRAAATFSVRFHANGGTGSMSSETKKSAAHLTLNKFTRSGFKFTKWSTTGNGSGSDYANGQSYGFKASISLYAQWSAVKPPVVPTAIHAVVALSPFGAKSSALSNALESQITALANEIKTNHDTKISLVGYSGDLTTANATNESDWAASLKLSQQRALAVEVYLKLQLASLAITNYSISAVGNAAALPPSANATAVDQARNRKVVAAIS